MRFPGSTINCSWNVPILLLETSIERSLKFGKPSTCTPSPHIRNWFPIIKDPEARIAIPSSPWARQWSFSTTCINFSGGQSPANVLRIFVKVAKISFGPTKCFPENLEKEKKIISAKIKIYSNQGIKKSPYLFNLIVTGDKSHDVLSLSLLWCFVSDFRKRITFNEIIEQQIWYTLPQSWSFVI